MRGPGSVLITDADRGSALSAIRSLGRRGWKVIAAGEERRSIGFHSRFASERLVYPSPVRHPAAFVDFLLELVSSRPIDWILPVTDAAILPLFQERARFEGRTRLALPDDEEAFRAVMDKDRTLELAASLGVPAPRSVMVDSLKAAQAASRDIGWPLVLKPRSSRTLQPGRGVESFEVRYAGDSSQLVRAMESYAGRCGVLVQEYCPGAARGIGLLTHGGRPLAAFQHRRLHEVPITGGASSLRVSEPLDPVLYGHACRLMGALRWTGLALVEFKVGPAGPKLMEVNGRVWGSLPLAVMSGVDFPALLADLVLRGPPAPHIPPRVGYREGLRSRNLALDLTWILSALASRRRYPFLPAPSRADGWGGLLALADPTCRHDVQSLSDPLPGLAELPRIAARLWRKVRG